VPLGPDRSEYFEALVTADASGEATPEERAELEAEPARWQAALEHLLDDTEAELNKLRRLPGPERSQVVADFEAERDRLALALARLTGAPLSPELEMASEPPRLQTTWAGGQLVVWVGGPSGAPVGEDELRAWLAEAEAPTAGWIEHPGVPVPSGDRAVALAAPLTAVLGWLAHVAAEDDAPDLGGSVRWVADMAVWAVELVAQGRMVPQLSYRAPGRPANEKGPANEAVDVNVQWAPALVDARRLGTMVERLPGAVTALENHPEPKGFTRTVLAAFVDAICRVGAERLEVPAPPPAPSSAAEMAEAFLSRFDGSRFRASKRVAAELTHRLERWAKPVTQASGVQLVVQLDPPDEGNAWQLTVSATGIDRHPVPLDRALVTAPGDKRRGVENELGRLERLLPALLRPGGHRRGEVVLSQDEAWELMSTLGRRLAAAGFDVRVPRLATRRATPTLRLEADPSTPSVVGAHQLADVRWSVLFDDVELDAAEIARLASEARPLVKSRGHWVAVDHADLAAAAAALAERESTTRMSGAELLRHALGLEGQPLAGGLTIAGHSWAADLLAQAEAVAGEPMDAPDGFVGELRHYQADALAWLDFLERGGLGGCLALDMGLGKTPTVLAHALAHADAGPTLVIAPPAVVGNWAAEARRFTPSLRVVVHHGASRASEDELAKSVVGADVVLTTYGTSVRDIDALAELPWARLVLDEAQVIKNPASETAQQLRRIDAPSRLALTGTPIENGLGDLWAILDFTNPGLVGPRAPFIANLSGERETSSDRGESALRALNGLLVFRRTKAEPSIAAELPERIDQLDHCSMTAEQIGLYQAVLDELVLGAGQAEGPAKKGQVLAAITHLKQICNHPAAYRRDDLPLAGRSGKLSRLEEIVEAVFAAGERVLIFTHFAQWGEQLAGHLSAVTGVPVECYHGGLTRPVRDRMVAEFQAGKGPGALVLSLKAGGTGLNLTAASHVVLYDRWWNPAVEDQARDRAWRIGQTKAVVAHRLVCPGTVDERVEEVVAGKRQIADLVLPKSSSIADLDADQLRQALGLSDDLVVMDDAVGDQQEARA
jgi:superfamily II DNA or RNA helicase